MKIAEAIDILSSTYMSLESVARGLDVNPADVAKALASATPDTTEYVCLQALAKAHPNTTIQETINDTDTE
jgi:hypothetical protein